MRRMTDWLRDKSRDELVDALNASGVGARMAERGRLEEEFKRQGDSLGVIDIAQGAVKWVNVVRHVERGGQGSSKTTHHYVFGIPSERGFSVLREPRVELSSVKRRNFPVFGPVKGVEWKGHDGGSGLVSALSMAPVVEAFCLRHSDLHIRWHRGAFQGWTVEMEKWKRFSHRDWAMLETIARLMLSTG